MTPALPLPKDPFPQFLRFKIFFSEHEHVKILSPAREKSHDFCAFTRCKRLQDNAILHRCNAKYLIWLYSKFTKGLYADTIRGGFLIAAFLKKFLPKGSS